MHRVFVYGTLKEGERNSHLLAKANFLGKAYTQDTFKMRTVGFPVIHRAGNGHPVAGEVYEIDDNTLYNLDQLENEGSMYNRETVDVIKTVLSENDQEADYYDDVFIYVGNADYWGKYKAREYTHVNEYGELEWTP